MCFQLQIMTLAGLLNFLLPMTASIDPNCDFYQEMAMGTEYYVYNLGYPENYGPSSSCRWVGTSPEGTLIAMTCDDIDIPLSENCGNDRLVVSLTGDPDFADGEVFCGRIAKTFVSSGNAVSVGLFSSSSSTGGRFLCSLTAMQTTPLPTSSIVPNKCDCGWRQQTRIVGGNDTGVNEYPSMAALIDRYTFDAFCGASIVSERYALTAVHCLLRKQPGDLGLLVGDHDLSTGDDTAAASLYRIASFVTHPQYDAATQQNDIAILRTAQPVTFSVDVGPVCLPFRYTWMDFNARTVTALGWGFLDFSGNKSDVLQQVDLSVVSNAYCASQIPDPITDQQVCTYAPNRDTCLSDSGGPLLWQDPMTRKLQLVGIISYGIGCATTKPAVNTRVTSYLSWIVAETRDAVYCIK